MNDTDEPIVRYIPLVELQAHPRNYNAHPDAQIQRLQASLRTFGQPRPIVVHRGTILAGHGVVQAALAEGWSHIWCSVVPDAWTPERAQAFMVADNETRRGADPDAEALADLIDEARQEVDLAALGFDDASLSELIASLTPNLPAPGGGGDEFDATPDDGPTRSQMGDLWLIGGTHRLIVGDCTDPAVVANLMGGERAELCFTSPPYADMRTYGGIDVSVQKIASFLSIDVANLFVVNLGLKFENNEIVEYWQEYIQQAKSAGLKFLSWSVWDRGKAGTMAHATAFILVEHEWVFVFGKGRKEINRTQALSENTIIRRKYNKRDDKGRTILSMRKPDGRMMKTTTKEYDAKKIGTVARIPPYLAREGIDHPAMFPIAFPTFYIEAMTNPGDLVYDPFSGSGTTLIAAHRTNRRCYVCEIVPRYADIILQRAEAEGLTVERVATELTHGEAHHE